MNLSTKLAFDELTAIIFILFFIIIIILFIIMFMIMTIFIVIIMCWCQILIGCVIGIAIDGGNEVALNALEVLVCLLKRQGKVAALEEEIEGTAIRPNASYFSVLHYHCILHLWHLILLSYLIGLTTLLYLTVL